MSIKVVFACDHDGCKTVFTLDTAALHDSGDHVVPIDLAPVVRFLTDDPSRGGRGWEFAVNKKTSPQGSILLFHKCFCPEHAGDLKTLPEYKPDTLAQKHARRLQ
jgi:hypothetical protein